MVEKQQEVDYTDPEAAAQTTQVRLITNSWNFDEQVYTSEVSI